VSEGACCKAAQEYSAQRDGRRVRAVDTIYPDTSILVARWYRSGKKRGSVEIYAVEIYAITKDGEELVGMSDLYWKCGGTVGLPAWDTCIGYWTGTLTQPPITSPYEQASVMDPEQNKCPRKACPPPKKSPKKESGQM
jgi:hypothetical protein